ncbi:hypothetical protein SAZ11_15105 [Streptomyces sp. FXJ1.4098]|nr:hypothetical protein [Streptomyces sp. FXJ1.4098]
MTASQLSSVVLPEPASPRNSTRGDCFSAASTRTVADDSCSAVSHAPMPVRNRSADPWPVRRADRPSSVLTRRLI